MLTKIAVTGVLLSCTVLAACVRTRTEMLDSSTAVMTARWDDSATHAKVFRTVLVDAAHTAQSRGFSYFKIVSAQDASLVHTWETPGHSHSSGDVNGYVSPYGNFDGTYNGNTDWTPPETHTAVVPGGDILIKFYHDGEIDPHGKGVWNVADVLAQEDDSIGNQSNAPEVASVKAQPQPDSTPPPTPDSEGVDHSNQVATQRFDSWQKQKPR